MSFLHHEQISIKSYTVLVTQRLAQGGFGYVDLAKDVRSGKEVVLKRCSIARQESFAIVNKEIRILQQFKGPYVVELIAEDIINNNGKQEAILLLELCPGGHLLQRLIDRSSSKSYYNQNEIYKIFGQICSAVKSLHENTPPITHRDLKLENILFGIDGNVRLCDFGSCAIGYTPLNNASERSAAEEIIAKETTQMYRAPELIDLYMREMLTEKSDIWALGCILYAISFLKHPFQDIGGLGILSCNVHYPNDPPVSEESKILMKRMLDFDPEARPSTGQIIDGIAALLRNEPLPHYELSADAVKKRQERLDHEAAKAAKREQKKKVKEVITPKKNNGQLDSNSVAARRLAAAKGLPISSGHVNHGDTNLLGSLDEAATTTFADFGSFSLGESSHVAPPVPPQEQSSFNGFDAFANDNFTSSQPSASFQSFDAFSGNSVESFPAFPSTSSDTFPVSQFASSSIAENGFDMFKDDLQPSFSTSLFSNFPNDSADPVSRGSFTLPSASTSPRGSITSTTDIFQDEVYINSTSALPSLFGTAFANDSMQVLPMSTVSTPRGSFTSATSLTPLRGSQEIDLLGDYDVSVVSVPSTSTSTAPIIDFLNDQPKQSRQSSAAAAVLSLFDTANENGVLRPSNLSGTSPPPNPFKDVQIKRDAQYKLNKPIDPFAELSFIQKR